MADTPTSELGRAVQEVTEKAQLLVREEIALAKAEMTEKVTGLAKGAVVGLVGGIFAVAGLIYLLHAVAWLIWRILSGDVKNVWIGFLIVAGVLFLLGGVAGFLAARFFKKGTPPKPAMAIEEAQLIRQTISSSRPAHPEGPAAAVQAPAEAHREGVAR